MADFFRNGRKTSIKIEVWYTYHIDLQEQNYFSRNLIYMINIPSSLLKNRLIKIRRAIIL